MLLSFSYNHLKLKYLNLYNKDYVLHTTDLCDIADFYKSKIEPINDSYEHEFCKHDKEIELDNFKVDEKILAQFFFRSIMSKYLIIF